MDIFTRIDNFNHSFLGFNPLGALKNIRVWRHYITILLLTSITCWVTFGWESTWNQLSETLRYLPSIIIGQTSPTSVLAISDRFYGIGQHLSSAVIYGICFLLLSIHLEKLNIKKSLNFTLTVLLSFLSVGVYEIIYNVLYSNLQHQPWTFSLQLKQGLNISMFTFFIFVGAVSLFYLYSLGFKPNFNKITKIFLIFSVLTYALWVFFPFPTTPLSINTTAGTWTSTNLFPQTMYAIDINPLDSVAIGNPVYVQNDLLHLVNVLNKVFVSLTILSFVMIRRNEKNAKICT